MTSRLPYRGSASKLVMAFDIGTTFSGVSYSILQPGDIPEIRRVDRFPAQKSRDLKIPTILYYDQQGKVRAAGAEAVAEDIEEMAEDKQWIKSEWFKLYLRPKTNSAAYVKGYLTDKAVPLSNGKDAIDIFTDFLGYLYECARVYIEDTYPNGATLWSDLQVQATADFVLVHPNGWEWTQQNWMREAATLASLIPDTPGGEGIVIVNAGGGMIDVSAYKQKDKRGQNFEEIAVPQCHFKGSIFVSADVKSFFKDLLSASKFVDDVPQIARCFDRTTKLGFKDPDQPQFVKFGNFKDNDATLGIRRGQLRLLGSDVASFFAPSIECIKESIEMQCAGSQTPISTVFLVGGFAASDYIYAKLREDLTLCGLEVRRPDAFINATADGAVSFWINRFVVSENL